jgi:DNA-binding CsgD family transcriptional regulator
MTAALREARDPLGWLLSIGVALVNVALGVSPVKAAGVAAVVLLVKIGAGLAWPRPNRAPAPVVPVRAPGHPIRGSRLTQRELEVASFTPLGLSNKEIGRKLVPPVRERGVDKHIANIMYKLNVHSREEIAAWYVRQVADGSSSKARQP